MQHSEIAKVSQELVEGCDNLSAVGEHGLPPITLATNVRCVRPARLSKNYTLTHAKWSRCNAAKSAHL